jgi:hypothetical protein
MCMRFWYVLSIYLMSAMDQDNDWDHMGHLTHHCDLPGLEQANIYKLNMGNYSTKHLFNYILHLIFLGVSVPMNEDEDTDWLHRGHLTPINDLPRFSEPIICCKICYLCLCTCIIECLFCRLGRGINQRRYGQGLHTWQFH